MNRARDQLLAGARFSSHQHGHVGRADLVDLFDQASHRRTGMNEARHQARAGGRALLFFTLRAMATTAQGANVHAQLNYAQQRIQRHSARQFRSIRRRD